MVQLIQESWAKVDPEKINYYFNKEKHKINKAKANNVQGKEKINLEIKAASELLKAGETESAIIFLQQIVTDITKNKLKIKKSQMAGIKKLIAIAYMRLSEQENCISNQVPTSCIIPISKEARHKVERGSRTAIDIYNSILTENPNDLESKWLLNLAYMTLGEYPSKVPAEYLIPPSSFNSDYNLKQFKNVAEQNNIDILGLTGGSAIEDFNNDGLLDIIVSSWGINDQIQILLNSNNGFKNVTEQSGLLGITGGINIIQGDYNGDGYTDIFVLRGAWFNAQGKFPNSLLKNNGDGTFEDVTEASGLLSFNPTQTAAFADFNLDGQLDLIIANEAVEGEESGEIEYYINQGDGTFKNEAEAAGLNDYSIFAKGLAVGDINDDLYPDIYISAYNAENKLLMNTGNQDPLNIKFVDITEFANTGKPAASFPTWFFDYNNDGLEDLFVGSYPKYTESTAQFVYASYTGDQSQGPRCYLYKNNGDNTFDEVGIALGLDEPQAAMGCNIGDLDNDGYLDFYLGTGDPHFESIVPNRMYKNDAGKKFLDVTTAGGFGHLQKGNAISFADLDNDGDQDIYAVMGGSYEGDVFQNALFKNPYNQQNNWIKIRLEGKQANRSALGAKIKINITENGKERIIYRSINTGSSFGANPLLAEIGLGKAKKINALEVIWPYMEESISSFKNIEVNQRIKIVEGESDFIKQNIVQAPLKD